MPNTEGGGGTPSSVPASDVTLASGTGLNSTNAQSAFGELKVMIDDVAETSGGSTLPSYYAAYLPAMLDSIVQDKVSCEGDCDDFIFITDPHWRTNRKNSTAMIQYLCKNGLTKKVINGGDACNSSVTQDGGHQDTIEEIKYAMLSAATLRAYADCYYVRGNHDFNGPAIGSTSGSGWKVSRGSERMLMTNMISDNRIVCNTNDATTPLYYYFDNAQSRLRYIVLYMYSSTSFATTQAKWVCERLLDAPSDYNIVFISHDGCVQTTASQNSTTYNSLAKPIVDAYNSRSSITIDGTSYDFSAKTKKILAFVSGHLHRDLQCISEGVAHISVNTDNTSIAESAQLGALPIVKQPNTVYEQSFDYILVDVAGSKVKCTKFGLGSKTRLLHLTESSILVNGSVTLTPSITGTLTWGSYDSLASHDEVNNTVVSVSNGVVTGLLAGEATVYVNNAEGDREFWGIKVS